MQKTRGFTLIELLVAIAIFTVVSVMAYQSLSSFIQSREKLQTKSNRLADLQIAYVIMSQDLEQSVARPIKDEYLQIKPGFVAIAPGRDQFLEFSRTGYPNPAGLPRSHLIRIAYSLKDGVLQRTVWEQLDRTGASVKHSSPFITGIKNLEIRYLNKQNQWLGSWPQLDLAAVNPSNPNSLQIIPTAIEVKMSLDDLGEIRWVFASEG